MKTAITVRQEKIKPEDSEAPDSRTLRFSFPISIPMEDIGRVAGYIASKLEIVNPDINDMTYSTNNDRGFRLKGAPANNFVRRFPELREEFEQDNPDFGFMIPVAFEYIGKVQISDVPEK